MPSAAVAAANQQAADAAYDVIALGGSAVDGAVAATLVTMVNEPGIVGLGGSAIITVDDPGDAPRTIDGNVAMPHSAAGAPLPAARQPLEGWGAWEITVDYGGGIAFAVGPGTVGVPGACKALGAAHRRYGRVPWRVLCEPAIDTAAKGFPLSSASASYLPLVDESMYGWHESGRAYVQACASDEGGYVAGSRVVAPELAATLRRLADAGPDDLYDGDIASVLVADQRARGGFVSAEDLRGYAVLDGTARRVGVSDWQLATPPPPTLGGPVLVALLAVMAERALDHPGDSVADVWWRVQRDVLTRRSAALDPAGDLVGAGHAWLDDLPGVGLDAGIRTRGFSPRESGSTVHTSVVDGNGQACSITASTGYGSGVVVPGTGMMCNNCLGEPELNRTGYFARESGSRIATNMAPSTGRRSDGAVLAIGGPGADRITTSVAQVVWAVAMGHELGRAVAAPRVHVHLEPSGGDYPFAIVHSEPGADVTTDLPHTVWDGLHMYFGGVTAAMREPDGSLVAAADPRRDGGVVTRSP